ncbi:phage antirepressor YoqD-like protein [Aneurinibacillus soli]|uniref:Phage antirepressor protein KilAC domain protein n=1 Tax=Aneurinibacillus soli TaxID=1500254 RepID=A0A0U5AXR5_9BACL|nr:phage antirepressor KilAC domain-containing protein [Aneurinibacillus soli]PYE61613.1 phage antirepressor YoqD-like protein [Aneurinibacillus soli]BAU28529.1 Phage antirepressor protein KilAC domain protein [Aneurinibacillus soli]
MDLINFEGHEVRVLNQDGTEWDGQQEAWFIPKEVAVAIGAANPKVYASQIINPRPRKDEEIIDRFEGFKGVCTMHTPGGKQQISIINENGLYMFLMASDLPEAVKFQRKVVELLKNIRRGNLTLVPSYQIQDEIARAQRWIEEQKEKRAIEAKALMLEQQVAENESKVTYYNLILSSKGTVNITQIAKDYGLSGTRLNEILHEEGVQYKMGGQWLLYHKHQNKGYTKSKTHIDGGGKARMHTKWTQAGRLFIHQLLNQRGIMAVIDREMEAEA